MKILNTGESEQEKKWVSKFFVKLALSITILPVIMWIWPESVPFTFFGLWDIKGSLFVWIVSAWPFFAYAAVLTTIYSLVTRNDPEINRRAEDMLTTGTLTSMCAGIVEEITFRWLFFFLGIITVKVINFLFFGFLGFGVAEWFHMHVFGVLANWTTLGYLENYLFHESGWAVGAGLLSANAFFRDGHKFYGLFGWINSWFAGVFLFWIMFQYGLLSAIFVHFFYDFIIFFIRYVDAAIERARGWS